MPQLTGESRLASDVAVLASPFLSLDEREPVARAPPAGSALDAEGGRPGTTEGPTGAVTDALEQTGDGCALRTFSSSSSSSARSMMTAPLGGLRRERLRGGDMPSGRAEGRARRGRSSSCAEATDQMPV